MNLDILGVTEEQELKVKENDFLISQEGKIILSTSDINLNDLVEEYYRTDLKTKEYLDKGSISHNQLLDCLIDGMGYVLCIHEKDGVKFRIPKYEISKMRLSKIQTEMLIDYVMEYEPGSIKSLTDALELDSDYGTQSIKGKR